MDELQNVGSRAANRLREIALQIENLSPEEGRFWTKEIKFSDLKGDLADLSSEISNNFTSCLSIYTFRISRRVCKKKLFEAVEYARNSKFENRAYPRINTHLRDSDTQFIYVGSSQSTANRLKQHLGIASPRTYSLQLSSWASDLEGEFILNVFPFNPNVTPKHFLPYLEDQVAFDSTPLLGRRGMR